MSSTKVHPWTFFNEKGQLIYSKIPRARVQADLHCVHTRCARLHLLRIKAQARASLRPGYVSFLGGGISSDITHQLLHVTHSLLNDSVGRLHQWGNWRNRTAKAFKIITFSGTVHASDCHKNYYVIKMIQLADGRTTAAEQQWLNNSSWTTAAEQQRMTPTLQPLCSIICLFISSFFSFSKNFRLPSSHVYNWSIIYSHL